MVTRFYKIEKTINIPLIPITLNNAQIVANKLCRHFKLPKVRLSINKSYRTVRGQYFPAYYAQIYLHKNHINIKVLIHELSHHWRFSKDGFKSGQKHHTNKELRYMTRMHKYCAKKDYWRMLDGVGVGLSCFAECPYNHNDKCGHSRCCSYRVKTDGPNDPGILLNELSEVFSLFEGEAKWEVE